MRALVLIILGMALANSAAAQRSIEFAAAPQSSDALIVAVSDPENIEALAPIIGNEAIGNLGRAIARSGFSGEAGETASFVSGAEQFGEIHVIGVSGGEMADRDWEDFGGRAGVIAKSSKAERVSVITPGGSVSAVVNAAFGAAIGQYSFDKYKSDAEPVTGAMSFVSENADIARSSYDGGRRHLADAVIWTRNMQSEPANAVYPEEFVRRARAEFRDVANVSITVFDVNDMERRGMGAILGVGQGSVRPPRMMITRYNGGGDEAPIVYAGKGITFDTGGISIKPNNRMWMMKADMTGAAAVTATVMSLAKSQAPVNVIAIAALAENMPGGRAQRPGDVVRSMSGKTIEIMSTDAEGRLVLADAVWYAQQEFNPRLLVDVATLTGSVGAALSDEYAGLFSRQDDVAERLLSAGKAAGEDLWRLPLHANHFKQVKSVIADVKNSDTGAPGASTGAAFIGSFVHDETPWAHLDIAGVDWQEDARPTIPLGASGFSVRLLDRLARDSSQ